MINQLEKKFTKSKIFLILEIFLILGIFLGKYIFEIQNNLIFLFILLLILLAILFIFPYKLIKVLVIGGMLIFVGIYYYNWYLEKITPKIFHYNETIEAKALVIDESILKDTTTQYKVKIIEMDNDIDNLVGEKILVSASKYPVYQYGDILKIKGKLLEPKIYEDFDYKSYLLRYQTNYIIYNTDVEYISSNNANKVFNAIYNLKNQAQINMQKILPEPEASFLGGLILGARKSIPKALTDAFNATGTSHIVAISGLNIVILLRFFQIFTKRWPKNLVFIVGILGLVFYSILTGLTASVVRASILAGLFLLARQIGRKANMVNILIFTAILMILENPLIVHYDVGFQLSFMAVLGIVYLSPIFNKLFSFTPRIITEIISTTLASQIATLPITVENFGRISIISPLVNVLILLVVNFATIAGMIIVIISFLSITVAQILGYFVYLMLKYIIIIVEYFAQLKISLVNLDLKLWEFIILYYIILVLFGFYLYRKNKLTTFSFYEQS